MSASAWYPLVPLAIAVAALVVREGTRVQPGDPKRQHASSEFVAPDLALLGARAPASEQELAVEVGRSSARLGEFGVLRVRSGSAVARAEDAGWTLELALELPESLQQPGELELRLRTRGVQTSAVPGCRTASMRGTWAADSLGGDVQFDASWMRLPGGVARLQGVIGIAGWKLGREGAGAGLEDELPLALELQLVPRGTRR